MFIEKATCHGPLCRETTLAERGPWNVPEKYLKMYKRSWAGAIDDIAGRNSGICLPRDGAPKHGLAIQVAEFRLS